MTVSPNRPQDGNLQPAAGGSPVGPNDRSRPVETPPTLFKLPNLGAKRTQGHVEAPSQAPSAGAAEPASVSLAMEPQDSPSAAGTMPREPIDSGPVPFAPLNRGNVDESAITRPNFDHFNRAVGPPEGSAGSIDTSVGRSSAAEVANNLADSWSTPMASDSGLSSSSSDAASPTNAVVKPPAPTSEASNRDLPAGRTWMDALGSHGVVIVLLLLVVAAALLTGNGEEDPTATSMSTQSELLNFDDLSVDLPLPTHGGSINLAESEPAATEEEVDPVSSSDLTENLVDAPAIAVSPEPAAAQTTSPASQPVTDAPVADPVASLEAPVAAATSQSSEAVDAANIAGVQFNRFVASEGMVEAMTVGRRVEKTPTDSSLPSLEELAGLQDDASPSPETTPKSPVRVLSTTPVGIPDWSKYLPPLDSALTPDAGLPSSSNQVVQP